LAELKEQHRNYHDLFIIARPDRLPEPSERKEPRPRVRRSGD